MGFTVPDLDPVPESQIFFTTREVKHASQREGDRTEKPKKVAKGKGKRKASEAFDDEPQEDSPIVDTMRRGTTLMDILGSNDGEDKAMKKKKAKGSQAKGLMTPMKSTLAKGQAKATNAAQSTAAPDAASSVTEQPVIKSKQQAVESEQHVPEPEQLAPEHQIIEKHA